MGMFPAAKGPGDHDVAKRASRFARSMLGRPGLGERADAKANLHARPWLFDGAAAFNHPCIFPGRSEPRKRVRLGVKSVNEFRGSGHRTSINEQFTHKQ